MERGRSPLYVWLHLFFFFKRELCIYYVITYKEKRQHIVKKSHFGIESK